MRLSIRSGPRSGQSVELTQPRLVVGRDPGCDVILDDEQVSRQHAALLVLPDGTVAVDDLGSTNGTFVNGQRITVSTPLAGGDQVRIGGSFMEIETLGPPVAAQPGAEARPPVAAGSSPSRVERLALTRSARHVQLIATIVICVAVAGIAVGALYATGVLGGSEKELSVPAILEQTAPSTVQIANYYPGQSTPTAFGTGWVWDAGQGLVITNAHVVIAGDRFTVRLATEKRERPAELVGVAPCEDLAALRVSDTTGMRTMPLGSQSDLARGDKVIAFGFPGSLATAFNPTANVGIVSVSRTRSVPLGYTAALPDVIQTDVAHNPGNSGGPLVNRRGQLVGMTTFSNRQLEGQRYAIGVDRVKVIVPDLVAGRSIGWAGLGWDVELPPDVLAQLGLNGAAGLPILDATPGTGAADAHVPTPSLLVRVQGKPVTADVGDYCRLVGNARAGDTARLTFLPANSDQPVDVNVTFR